MATLDVLQPVSAGLTEANTSSNSTARRRSTAEQAELTRIGAQIENAQTLAEVREAAAALRVWAGQHPEDRERLSAVFEQLSMLEEGAREAQAECEVMRLTPEEIRQREQLFALRRHVRAEDTPETFAATLCATREALANWEAIHPEDPQLLHLRAHLDTEAYIADVLHEAV